MILAFSTFGLRPCICYCLTLELVSIMFDYNSFDFKSHVISEFHLSKATVCLIF